MGNESPVGNPGVVGLAGFGITTMLLQFHNVGWCDVGPVVSMAFIFGGLAQMIAGYQEFKCGNNFGYSAFVSYGAFWIALGIIFLLNHFNIYHSSTTDVGWFLVAWTIYTAIMWIPGCASGCHGGYVYPAPDWVHPFGLGAFAVSGINQGCWLRTDAMCAVGIIYDGTRHLCAGFRP